jgi:hypothetical protein
VPLVRQADEARGLRRRDGPRALRLHQLRSRPAAGYRRPQVGRKFTEASGEVTNRRTELDTVRSGCGTTGRVAAQLLSVLSRTLRPPHSAASFIWHGGNSIPFLVHFLQLAGTFALLLRIVGGELGYHRGNPCD